MHLAFWSPMPSPMDIAPFSLKPQATPKLSQYNEWSMGHPLTQILHHSMWSPMSPPHPNFPPFNMKPQVTPSPRFSTIQCEAPSHPLTQIFHHSMWSLRLPPHTQIFHHSMWRKPHVTPSPWFSTIQCEATSRPWDSDSTMLVGSTPSPPP